MLDIARIQRDIRAAHSLEAWRLGCDLVSARGQFSGDEQATLAGRGCNGEIRCGVSHGNLGIRNRRTRGVCNNAGELAVLDLGCQQNGNGTQEQNKARRAESGRAASLIHIVFPHTALAGLN